MTDGTRLVDHACHLPGLPFLSLTVATSHPPPLGVFHAHPYHNTRGPTMLTMEMMTAKTIDGVEGMS